MPALTGPALVAAILLTLAGAQKVLEPTTTVGALKALRLPSSTGLVRTGAAAELVLGVAVVAIGGSLLWWLMTLSYLAFAGFVLAALRKGTMLGSCGCFGREDTPPHWVHVIMNLALAGVAGATAAQVDRSLLSVLAGDPARSGVLIGLATLAVYLLYAVYVQLPRTLAAPHTHR